MVSTCQVCWQEPCVGHAPCCCVAGAVKICTHLLPSLQVDLCHGPHLPNTGYLKTSGVNAFNRAFWRADVNKEPLQVPN